MASLASLETGSAINIGVGHVFVCLPRPHKGPRKPVEVSDEQLIARTLSGEIDAFGMIYERYHQPVFATVARILRDRGEAQDAAQEVFIKIYRSLSTWDVSKARFSSWVYRLAANHAIDCWRLRRRRAEIGLAEVEGLPAFETRRNSCRETGNDYPERALEEKERVAEIRRRLEGLSRIQRRVFVLRHFQGLKLREISVREGFSIATVKGSLYRTVRILRQKLPISDRPERENPALLAGDLPGR